MARGCSPAHAGEDNIMPTTPAKKLLNSPLKNAKGLGSAHGGVDHWISQKVTAIANIPLIIWFVFSMINLYGTGATHDAFTAWVAHPVNTTLLVAMFLSVFYHAKLGTQTVVEDYVSCPPLKKLKLIGLKLFFTLMTIGSIIAVLKIAFTA